MSWFSNRGMHWSRSQNRRLRDLAEMQAFQFSPWMEDAEEESDGTIDVCFGSQGATIMLRRSLPIRTLNGVGRVMWVCLSGRTRFWTLQV
jgi:hypothetical protein